MDALTIRIVEDLKSLLKERLQDGLSDVILFGSQAIGSNSENSDYDILIITKNKADWKLERVISDTCYEIDLKYGIITDTHILAEDELKSIRGKQPVFFNAINHGYHV